MRRSPMPPRRSPLLSSSTLRRTPLAAVSPKRRRANTYYRQLRADFLGVHQRCEYPAGCTQAATDVHHMRGRVGGDLLNVRLWLAMCRDHHEWVTVHPAAAYEMGASVRRIGGAA